ncbi:hypothetical protein [Polaromonas sp. JS666]|uniref:hypothetical protein n=1 Tax=Polaromonas sp. (strain JS666 / ATCC BAA-500) TaxID=296591 RepID=UPI000053587B|nr:hypothetical protein [Polaromonas sp. JS666]ABE47195.1 hypothetical protein Bpro_5339 [Polaromonas sp. JS666]
MKLSFTFYTGQPGKATRAPATATAELSLTTSRLQNFRALRNIAIEKNLASVEIYVHGVNWVGPTPTLETGDFIVCAKRGIALKAFSPATHGSAAIQSHWVDWETLSMDLLALMEEDDDDAVFAGSPPHPSACADVAQVAI